MNKIDYKSAYASALIANGMLRQENNHLKNIIKDLKTYLEEMKDSGISERRLYGEMVLLKLNELEGVNNESN